MPGPSPARSREGEREPPETALRDAARLIDSSLTEAGVTRCRSTDRQLTKRSRRYEMPLDESTARHLPPAPARAGRTCVRHHTATHQGFLSIPWVAPGLPPSRSPCFNPRAAGRV